MVGQLFKKDPVIMIGWWKRGRIFNLLDLLLFLFGYLPNTGKKQLFSITHCTMFLHNLPDLVRKLAANEYELTYLLIKILLLSLIHQSPQYCLFLECLFIFIFINKSLLTSLNLFKCKYVYSKLQLAKLIFFKIWML